MNFIIVYLRRDSNPQLKDFKSYVSTFSPRRSLINKPTIGFEPTTNVLQIHCSTIELSRLLKFLPYIFTYTTFL